MSYRKYLLTSHSVPWWLGEKCLFLLKRYNTVVFLGGCDKPCHQKPKAKDVPSPRSRITKRRRKIGPLRLAPRLYTQKRNTHLHAYFNVQKNSIVTFKFRG